mmetsp:Transcript_38838/g.63886  ORF Transcript_38838/g.63886 Transcript_38838/m.63886 type:complete len:338 (+) Transcript_38838:102-1115(+)
MYSIMMATAISHWYDKGDTLTQQLASINIILVASNSLFYLKGFAKLGSLVTMLEKVLKELGSFMLVLLVIILSFAAAFNLLYAGVDKEGLDYQDYDNYGLTLVTAFSMMIGEFNAESFQDASSPWLMFTIFVVYMIIMAVVLLNFIIAVLTDTYSSVKVSSKCQALWEKAKIILELHDFLPERRSRQIEEETKWVHVLLPEDWLAEQNSDKKFNERVLEDLEATRAKQQELAGQVAGVAAAVREVADGLRALKEVSVAHKAAGAFITHHHHGHPYQPGYLPSSRPSSPGGGGSRRASSVGGGRASGGVGAPPPPVPLPTGGCGEAHQRGSKGAPGIS